MPSAKEAATQGSLAMPNEDSRNSDFDDAGDGGAQPADVRWN